MAYTGKCYEVVSVGGVAQYGSTLTRSNAAHKRLFMYPNQSTGYGSLVVKPGDMRDLSSMTWAGFLNGSNKAAIAGLCAASGSPDFSTRLVDSIATATVIYGGVGAGGYSAGECFGTKLRLSGRSNQLVKFSLEMVGKVASEVAISAPGAGDSVDFFPLEKGTGGVEILGFDIDYETGFFARFAPDGTQGYTAINDSLQLRNLQATLFLAHGSGLATAAFGQYSSIGRAEYVLSLASPGGGSCSISMGGYFTDWQVGTIAGVMVERAVQTGVSDSGGMFGIN